MRSLNTSPLVSPSFAIGLSTFALLTCVACGEEPIVLDDLSETGESSSTSTTGDEAETGETGEEEPDPPPPPPAYDEWVKIEIPDTYCSDGSQYKFFVNWHEGSKDVAVTFEPGGACWDYASCSGELGILGAANPDGIPDNHMEQWGIHTPLVRRDSPQNAMRDWNLVFIPYCTGDVHTGSRVSEYVSEDGTESLTYRHVGHDNMMKVAEWLAERFPDTDRMYAGGCSAGGAGSGVNYYFLREAIQPERGYLLNDSGPLFPNSVNSEPLHDTIREVWGLDSVIEETPLAAPLMDDLGSINAEMADLFPEDRLATTYFIRDYNYSRYSYERFYDGIDKDGIHQLFYEDTLLLMDQYDSRENLAYYLPYFRAINDSHCATIIDFGLTDLGDWQLGDFIDVLLDDDQPLESRVDLDGTQGP